MKLAGDGAGEATPSSAQEFASDDREELEWLRRELECATS